MEKIEYSSVVLSSLLQVISLAEDKEVVSNLMFSSPKVMDFYTHPENIITERAKNACS